MNSETKSEHDILGLTEATKNTTTIKAEVQKAIIFIVTISLVLLGAVSCWLNYSSTEDALKQNMQVTAVQSAEKLQYRLKATMNLVEMIGTIPRMCDSSTALDEKVERLDKYVKTYDWQSAKIVGLDGITLTDATLNVSDRDYFKKALAGETNISDPIHSQSTGELITIVAAPMWEGGNKDTKVVGVVYITMDARSEEHTSELQH